MLDLRHDPRWLRLNDPMFVLPGFRGGEFDLDFDRPALWRGGDPVGGDDDFDPNNFLSVDYCIIDDKRFFIHGVAEAMILGGGGRSLAFGVWAEVSQASFNQYVVALEDQSALCPPLAASVANQIAGFDNTLGLPATMRPRTGKLRPAIMPNDTGSGLGEALLRGITLDRMLDIYAAVGMDLRPAISVTH
jgi:hypothetical protein